jgi:CheY-like chemotaxis protein
MKPELPDQKIGILVVDDHAISRRFTFEALRQLTSNIKLARTGHEAMSITRSWFPELIYTDIHLPDICGLRMVRNIRSAWPQQRRLPRIVVLTGDCSYALRQRIKQANVAEILLKPVQMEDIRTSAQRLIHTHSTAQRCSVQILPTVSDHELRELFSRELTSRIPLLDEHISRLEWKPASEILHQLIASSAMCQEREFESCVRLLHQAISSNPEPKTIAQAYHPFLRAAFHAKMHLVPN